MFGVILSSIGSFLGEISLSIGKVKVGRKEQSVYTMGFLCLFWGAIWFFIIILFRHSFVFALASLPTFIPRAFLEVAQAHATNLAVVKADRSTFGFIRVLTIPLLLAVDFFLGYKINTYQTIGIIVIVSALFLLLVNHGVKKQGSGFVVFTALNAVATISLFKYNISHFNSVEAEQLIIYIILLIYFFFTALYFVKENPLRFLFRPIFFVQSATSGAGGLLESFAYNFAPASIILAAKRSSAIFWSLASGGLYFKEQHILIKAVCLILLVGGIILLVV